MNYFRYKLRCRVVQSYTDSWSTTCRLNDTCKYPNKAIWHIFRQKQGGYTPRATRFFNPLAVAYFKQCSKGRKKINSSK